MSLNSSSPFSPFPTTFSTPSLTEIIISVTLVVCRCFQVQKFDVWYRVENSFNSPSLTNVTAHSFIILTRFISALSHGSTVLHVCVT